jgi:hypothetical protein
VNRVAIVTLLAAITIASTPTEALSPELCSDQGVLQALKKVAWNESDVGRFVMAQRPFAVLAEFGLPRKFGDFFEAAKKDQLGKMLTDWFAKKPDQFFCISAGPCDRETKMREATDKIAAMIQRSGLIEMTNALYDKALVMEDDAIADQYDPNLQRLTCRVTFRIDLAAYLEDPAIDVNPEAKTAFREIERLAIAAGKDRRLARYSVQPRGGGYFVTLHSSPLF